METVRENLELQQLWSQVYSFSYEEFEFCAGVPAKRLAECDEPGQKEYVLVGYTAGKWSVEEWARAFSALARAEGLSVEPSRLVMALITSDSTVVYYLVHNGLVKPRKN